MLIVRCNQNIIADGKMTQKLIKPLLIFCILLSGCDNRDSSNDANSRYKEYITQAKEQLEKIVVADGINKTEAKIIFEIYGFRFFNNNGWGKIEDRGNNWEGVVLDHWSDKPIKHKVIINKKTGATSWVAGPTIKNYRNLLEACPNHNYKTRC